MGVIQFLCEHCGKLVSVDSGSIGHRGTCPRCGTNFVVPSKSEAEALAVNEREVLKHPAMLTTPAPQHAAPQRTQDSKRQANSKALVGCFMSMVMLAIIGWGIKSYVSSNSTDTTSSDQGQLPEPPKEYSPSGAPLPAFSSKSILADTTSLEAFVDSFGLKRQPDDKQWIYSSGYHLNDNGIHVYNCPSVSVMLWPNSQRFNSVDIYVLGPMDSPVRDRELDHGTYDFPISSLDWRNKFMVGLIRLCCGQEVLDGLMAQIDKYLAIYGNSTSGEGVEFSEGGYNFYYAWGRGADVKPWFELCMWGQ
jgi:hypothetical protein